MLNNELLINSIRFFVLVIIQALLLNHVDFLGYINPYLYVVFILVYPISGNKSLLIFLSFLLGLSIDFFSDSGGIHAAASVFIAFIRPVILKYSFGISYEYNTVKVSNAEFGQRILYVVSMVFIHHFILFLLEIFNVNQILLILKSTLFSGIFSTILILSAITIFSKKSK